MTTPTCSPRSLLAWTAAPRCSRLRLLPLACGFSKESVWEALCNRHVSYASNGTRAVVAALVVTAGLYCRCVGPIADRLLVTGRETGPTAAVRLSLSMSLFSIDCYEVSRGGRQSPSSLLFLRTPSTFRDDAR
ncbi:hypothetical protein HPP92_020980 [Vanilla planifolia]|uniref:Uncharacterized protein n=1 Tax=Vanilla planifolia TaxID=51239 RepID=A0A835UHE3_VANPL|nr:hypothetical protein HPP92_021272 [Vanilla planifolia]KAG0462504.1 hypothetical protein HPP92_020980 [Vanilla planifolia]